MGSLDEGGMEPLVLSPPAAMLPVELTTTGDSPPFLSAGNSHVVGG